MKNSTNLLVGRFLKTLPSLLKYLVVTKILQALVIFPLFWAATQILLGSAGYPSLNNSNVASFLLTWQGAIWIIALAAVVFITIIMEIGGYMMIAAVKYAGKKDPSYGSILRACIQTIPALIGPGLILIVVFTLIILPLVGSNLNLSFMAGLRIPNFITSVINANPLYYTAYLLVLLLLNICVFFSVFFFHFLLLGRLKTGAALKESYRLIIPRILRFFGFILFNALVALLLVGAVLAATGIIGTLVALIPSTPEWENALLLTTLVTFSFFTATASFVATPFFVFLLTDRYYTYLDEDAPENPTAARLATQIPNIPAKEHPSPLDRLARLTPVLVIGALATVTAATGLIAHNLEELSQTPHIPLIGHRGGPGDSAIENSLEAVEHSIAAGARYVEVDVQRTSDGYYVLNHDDTFYRLAGDDRSSQDMTLAQIQELDLGATSNGRFSNIHVPTVEELFATAQGRIGIFLELKGKTADHKMVDDMVKLIEKNNMTDEVILMSLSYDTIEYIEKRYPHMQSGFTYFVSLGDSTQLLGDYMIMEEDAASHGLVDTFHAAGKKVAIWTLNTEESMQKFVSWNIDGAITDYVDNWNEVVAQEQAKLPLERLIDTLFE